MERSNDDARNQQTKLLKVGATSTAFFIPIILAAAYLNMGQGQPCSCGGNCPPTPVNFVVTDSTDGAIADETSWEGVASSDGLTVAFSSYADNLGAPDDGSLSNVFVHDVRSEETTWINGAGAWFAVDPALTADGNYAVFAAYDDFLFGSYGWAVFGADTSGTGNTPELLNFPDANTHPQPTISGDGRYVAYRTANVTSGDTNGLHDIYIRDRQTDQVYPARRPFGSQYNVHAHSPELARDANRLVYQLGTQTIHFTDWQCFFSCPDETFAGTRPSISDDGAKIAYQVSDGGYDGIFVFDETTNTHQRASIDAWGRPASAQCDYPVISGDGRFVAFRCAEAMTSHGGTNQTYVRDLVAGTTKLASITSTGVPANEGATPTSLSSSGVFLILESTSTNLGTIAAGTKQVFRVPDLYWEAGCVPSLTDETTCNGIDDDCDGQIDENFVPYETTCGVGACIATGMATACNNGAPVITCTPGDPTGLLENFCNGVDDDCDGPVDEDADCVCYGNPSCDDGNPCTTDSCEPYVGCQNTPATPGDSCNDGDGECSDNGVCQCLEPDDALCDATSDTYTQIDARGEGGACGYVREEWWACWKDCSAPGFLHAEGDPPYFCDEGRRIVRNPGISCDDDGRRRDCELRESP